MDKNTPPTNKRECSNLAKPKEIFYLPTLTRILRIWYLSTLYHMLSSALLQKKLVYAIEKVVT